MNSALEMAEEQFGKSPNLLRKVSLVKTPTTTGEKGLFRKKKINNEDEKLVFSFQDISFQVYN